MPAAALVARHVAEVQRPVGHPDRPFRERASRRNLPELRVLVDQLVHPVGLHRNRHPCSFTSTWRPPRDPSANVTAASCDVQTGHDSGTVPGTWPNRTGTGPVATSL